MCDLPDPMRLGQLLGHLPHQCQGLLPLPTLTSTDVYTAEDHMRLERLLAHLPQGCQCILPLLTLFFTRADGAYTL